jgi:xanthine dehydrogenase molybdopterin-binding subunit B
MVLSEHPRARIVKIDTDAAMAMPGVVRVFTAADARLPGLASMTRTSRSSWPKVN